MNSREDIRKFMSIEQSMVQKAKRYDDDVGCLLDQLWRAEHTHAECEARMYSGANLANSRQIELASKVIEIITKEFPDTFSKMENIVLCTQCKPENAFEKVVKLVAEYQSAPAAC